MLSADSTLPADPAPAARTAPPGDSAGPARGRPPQRRRTATGRAPDRPALTGAFYSFTAATTGLLVLAAIGAVIHEPVLIPPLAASAALVHSAPTLPLAQPRSVLAGHLIGAAVGYTALATAGSSPWAAAVAAGITLALLMVARAPHSPACATTVVIVLQTPAAGRFVPLLLGAATLMILAEYAASRIRPRAPRYPAYWW
ncbi:HPP family protein [Streptomyces sp. NPDC016309]|uniref:HPP family protein n=1 Tax=Streptomyces sp. NPDC016309 TaxID=3364965 RepID=UPI0036F7D96F